MERDANLDDIDVAMLSSAMIAIVSVIVLKHEALPIILATITGIFGLARGEKRAKRLGA